METLASLIIVPAFVIAFFGCLFGLAQFISPDRLRRIRQSIWPVRFSLWQMMSAVAVAAFVILVFEKGYEVLFAFLLMSLFVVAWFVRAWCYEFVFLMGRRDDDFPGRHDKLVWLLVLFAFAPFSVWLFRTYRREHWPEPVPEYQAELHPKTQATTTAQPA
jgi:hypothetical protein